MIENKWIKLGAAAFLSIGVLAGCGDDDERQLEEDTEVVPDSGDEDKNPEDESDEEAEKDAKTDEDAED